MVCVEVSAGQLSVRRVAGAGAGILSRLSTLLTECVDGGAAVGFLSPLHAGKARNYWLDVLLQCESAPLWIAELSGELVGTVQLVPSEKENGSHRAVVSKLLVRPCYRRLGTARSLMTAVEDYARGQGFRLLVLDTLTDSAAARLYENMQWHKVGEIPMYVHDAHGGLYAMTIYYKLLHAGPASAAAPQPA